MRRRLTRDGCYREPRTIDIDGILFGVFVVCAVACVGALCWYAWARLHV